MKVLLLANNWAGWKIADGLRRQKDEIVGLVLPPTNQQKYGEEIRRCVKLDPDRIFDGSRLEEDKTLKAIRDLRPEIGLSVFFSHILKPKFLQILPAGCLNVHTALLPYNRGAYPNVWSIVEKTPAGASIHYIDEGIDTGDIVSQRPVPGERVDTGKSLYHKLERAAVKLFEETWPLVRSGKISRKPQVKEDGTFHQVRDVKKIDAIDLDSRYTARELIDILRARTFPPYPGAYFSENGRKIYLRLQLLYENQLGQGEGAHEKSLD